MNEAERRAYREERRKCMRDVVHIAVRKNRHRKAVHHRQLGRPMYGQHFILRLSCGHIAARSGADRKRAPAQVICDICFMWHEEAKRHGARAAEPLSLVEAACYRAIRELYDKSGGVKHPTVAQISEPFARLVRQQLNGKTRKRAPLALFRSYGQQRGAIERLRELGVLESQIHSILVTRNSRALVLSENGKQAGLDPYDFWRRFLMAGSAERMAFEEGRKSAAWCAAWSRDEGEQERGVTRYCLLARQPRKGRPKYEDSLKTACGRYVICTTELSKRAPTCVDCLAVARRAR